MYCFILDKNIKQVMLEIQIYIIYRIFVILISFKLAKFAKLLHVKNYDVFNI